MPCGTNGELCSFSESIGGRLGRSPRRSVVGARNAALLAQSNFETAPGVTAEPVTIHRRVFQNRRLAVQLVFAEVNVDAAKAVIRVKTIFSV